MIHQSVSQLRQDQCRKYSTPLKNLDDQTLPIKECPNRSFEARTGPPSSIFGASRGQIDKQLAQQGESEKSLNVLDVAQGNNGIQLVIHHILTH